MRAMSKRYTSVDEYLADQPEEIRELLEDLREIIKKAAPQAAERISYNMPAYDLNGAIRFPPDKPLPKSLITRIVKFRLMENLAKAGKKKLSKGK